MLRQLRRLCRHSIIQRHFLRACSSHRSALSDSPAAAATKDPRWVMLNLGGRRMDDSFVANAAKTVSDSPTFTGQHLRVSLGGAAPPASSFLYYDFPDSAPGPGEEEDKDDDDNSDISVDVVAAHTDSVLLRMGNKRCPSVDFDDNDYLVYRAGASEPPSLSLLPDRDFLTKSESVYDQRRPSLGSRRTGLLRRRRGENDDDDDLLVVQVDLWYDRDARREMAEFCVLRPGAGMRQWELVEPVPILRDDDDDGEAVPRSEGSAVIPVGDRYLCWVDYPNGFFLCDMADEASSKVRYVPLPTAVSGRGCSCADCDDKVFRMEHSMRMGSAGASKVRLVSIDPRCCCGGPGRSTCSHSRFSFTITTWTMDLGVDVESPLAWVKDAEIDCEEVWALPGYERASREQISSVLSSLDDPNASSAFWYPIVTSPPPTRIIRYG